MDIFLDIIFGYFLSKNEMKSKWRCGDRVKITLENHKAPQTNALPDFRSSIHSKTAVEFVFLVLCEINSGKCKNKIELLKSQKFPPAAGQ